MPFETVAISVNGVEYYDWESIEVSWEARSLEIKAVMTTVEISPPDRPILNKWNFPPGSAVIIVASGDYLMHGVVTSYEPQADADQHSITVTIENKHAKDFVWSSADRDRGWYDATDIKIVQDLASLSGLAVRPYTGPDIIRGPFQVRQGASNYAEAMRVLQNTAKMLIPQMDGTVAIIAGESFGAGGVIQQGVNILSMRGLIKSDRYQFYRAIGQSAGGTELLYNIQPHGTAEDGSAPINSLKIIPMTMAADMALAKRRAEWERNRASGEDIQAKVTVPGWRMGTPREGGTGAPIIGTGFWAVNTDVSIYAPWLQLDAVLRVLDLKFIQNLQRGTVTELTLVDPRTVGGPPGANHSSMLWQGYPKPRDRPPPWRPIERKPDGGGGVGG